MIFYFNQCEAEKVLESVKSAIREFKGSSNNDYGTYGLNQSHKL